MKYKEKYERGLECIQEILSGAGDSIKTSVLRKRLQPFFPELKDDKDEMIRKWLIDWARAVNWSEQFTITKEQVLAWLKKQGVQKPADKVEAEFHEGDWIVLNETVYQITEIDDSHVVLSFNGRECKFGLEVLNNAQKFESQFKVGDWIVQENIGIYKVIEVCESWYEVVDNKDEHYSISFNKEYMCHLWSINDTMYGDVLVINDDVFIYAHRKQMYSIAVAQCFVNSTGSFYIDGEFGYEENGKTISPATKEQRNLLFKKMKEAGYEWDSEKKELKKIEPKKLEADKVIAWLVANIVRFEYYVKQFKKDFGL